jgi:hypothetical protein
MSQNSVPHGYGVAGTVRKSLSDWKRFRATVANGFPSGVVLAFRRFRIFAALQFVLDRFTDEHGKPALADKRLDTMDRVAT